MRQNRRGLKFLEKRVFSSCFAYYLPFYSTWRSPIPRKSYTFSVKMPLFTTIDIFSTRFKIFKPVISAVFIIFLCCLYNSMSRYAIKYTKIFSILKKPRQLYHIREMFKCAMLFSPYFEKQIFSTLWVANVVCCMTCRSDFEETQTQISPGHTGLLA